MRPVLLVPLAALAILGSAARLSAQTTPTVTVIGLVVDAATRAPVSAARVSVGVGGLGVASNGLGQFALENVPIGARRLVVTRLGYQDFEQVVQITDPMGGVLLAISPDPLQLEGVSTKGATEGTLRGRVIDADTGEPIPWAPVTLTRDGIRDVSRRASSARSTNVGGDFEIPNLALGHYVLKVERPDYTAKLITINHEVPAAPLQITLSKDYRREAALTDLTAKFDDRKNSMGATAVAVGAEMLQSTAVRFMDQLASPGGFEVDAAGRPSPVAGLEGAAPDSLFSARVTPGIVGGGTGPILYIDGMKQDLGILQTYSPKEFYRVDYIGCPSGSARYVIAYTYPYIDERMKNPAMKDPTLIVCP